MRLACILVVTAALQENSLGDRSKAVFGPLVRVESVDGALRIKALATKEQLKSGLKDLWERLEVGIGVCQSPIGLSSVGGNAFKHYAVIGFQPFDQDRTFSWTFVDGKNGDLYHLRQEESGEVRMAISNTGRTVSMLQAANGNCTLVVELGGVARKWNGSTFKELLRRSGMDGAIYVLAELENFLGSAPLSPYSKAVRDSVVRIGVLSIDKRNQLDSLLLRVSRGSIEDRDEALGQLRQKSEADPSFGLAVFDKSKSERDPRVRKALEGVLRSENLSLRAIEFIAEERLYCDLEYLISALNEDTRFHAVLRELTGEKCDTKERWLEWYERIGKKLVWDSNSWRYR